MLLDEPSSALDPIAEYKMFENMMRATEGRSVIFISHRLSSAVLADRVVLMENGEIAEVGETSRIFMENPPALRNLKGESDFSIALVAFDQE